MATKLVVTCHRNCRVTIMSLRVVMQLLDYALQFSVLLHFGDWPLS